MRLYTGCFAFLGHLLQFVAHFSRHQDEIGAFACISQSYGFAVVAACAGDQCCFTLQFHVSPPGNDVSK